MNKLDLHRIILKENLFTLFGVCLLLYFTFHVVQGPRGVFSLLSVNQEIKTLSKISNNVLSERQDVDVRVSMMRPGSVDKDLLSEQVRNQLGYKNNNEYVVLGY
ncbi:MAG: hypothetical protein CMH26_06105 [Micavibrio sp.]|nr:hypothetical protein [Micavibrio sp.]|tara:strand:+ start:1588 stop:1899 length:312 start_codon:yes stop_codon:yes gene_type:complete